MRPLEHRYGIVLGLTILAVLFSILAPDTPIGRGISVLLQSTMLLAVIATSRERHAIRDARAVLVFLVLVALAVLICCRSFPVGSAQRHRCRRAGGARIADTRDRATSSRARCLAAGGRRRAHDLSAARPALRPRCPRARRHRSASVFRAGSNSAVTQSQENYFSFTTLTTTGYGISRPRSASGERSRCSRC